MFTTSAAAVRHGVFLTSAAVAVGALALLAVGSWQDTPSAGARELVRPAPAAPLAEQPAAKLVVSPPKAEPLARGVAHIEFRAENLQVVPVLGPAAAAASPRAGHLHVTVDDTAWH